MLVELFCHEQAFWKNFQTFWTYLNQFWPILEFLADSGYFGLRISVGFGSRDQVPSKLLIIPRSALNSVRDIAKREGRTTDSVTKLRLSFILVVILFRIHKCFGVSLFGTLSKIFLLFSDSTPIEHSTHVKYLLIYFVAFFICPVISDWSPWLNIFVFTIR